MRELIVASRNKGKVKEIEEVLKGLPFVVTSLLDHPGLPDIVEDGHTYEENAWKKALGIAQATGKLALADDSGIEVKALGNAPGIYSARFAGHGASEKDKNRKLFALLKDVPPEKRQARYVCVITVVDGNGDLLGSVRGTCSGYITTQERGTNGFGFDPIFLLKRYNKTFGELPPSVKASISHRARALRKIRAFIEKYQ